MIGPINIPINAANPQLPLPPVYAFAGSPTSVRVVDAPRRIGNWQLTAVYITATYPDNSIVSAACVQNGCMWVGTIAGCQTAGSSSLGFTVSADGIDENGATVTGYVLGKGDLVVLSADGTITVDGVTYYLHLVDTLPETPHKGDVYNNNGVWEIYTGSAWVSLSVTVDSTVTSSSQNPVKSSGIWTALWGNLVTAYDSIAAWVTNKLGEYVAKSGDTMTGELIINGGPEGQNWLWIAGGSWEGFGILNQKAVMQDSSSHMATFDAIVSTANGSNSAYAPASALSGITAADIVEFLGKTVFGTYKGEWNNVTAYSIGDIVLFSGKYYRAIESIPAGNPDPVAYTLSWGQGSGISPYPYTESAGVMKLLALFSVSGTAGQFNALLASLLANYLPLSGGTMTGRLNIYGNSGYGSPYLMFNNYTSGNSFLGITPVSQGVWRFEISTGGAPLEIVLPSISGTLALTSDLSSYLPLSGGTLTDALKICEPLYNTAGVVLGDTYVSPGPTYINPYGVSHESGYTGISEMSGAKWDNIIAAANGTLAAYAKTNALSSKTYNFATNADVYRAVRDIAVALGATVRNYPL